MDTNHEWYELFQSTKLLYDTVVQNFSHLNKTLEFESPPQLEASFLFALQNGYLSKNMHFLKTAPQSNDVLGLIGATICTGEGICRHHAHLLNDIFCSYGISSFPLYVYTGFNPIGQIFGDHAIVLSEYNGYKYFIDPCFAQYYVQGKNKNRLYLEDEGFIRVKLFLFKLLALLDKTNHVFQFQDLFSFDIVKLQNLINSSLPTILLEEAKNVEKNAKIICEENQDLFFKFWGENQLLYQDISENLVQLRKLKNNVK